MGNYTCLLNEKYQNEFIEGQSLDEQLQRLRIDRQFYIGQYVLWKQKNKGYIFSKKVTSSVQTTDHEGWHDERCQIDHKHLLKYYGLTYEYLTLSNLSETEIYFEFPTDTLHNFMTDYSKRGIFIPEQKIWMFISQIVDVLSYLYQKGYYHSCIDPRSFFLTEGDQLKTLYSRAFNDLISSYTKLYAGIENLGYMSPQQVVNFKNNIPDQGDPYKSDSFHFGLLILEMMSNKSGYQYLQLDFYNKSNSSIAFSKILHDLITCRSRYSVKLIQFVQSLLIFEESQRPIIPQMRNSMIIQMPQQLNLLNYQPMSSKTQNTKLNITKYNSKQNKTEIIKPQQQIVTTISTPKITAISDRINKFLTPQIKTQILSPGSRQAFVRVFSPSIPRSYTKTFLGVSPVRNNRNQTSPIMMSPKVIQFQYSPQNSPQQLKQKPISQAHSNQQTVKKVQIKHVNSTHLEQTRQRQH